MNDIVKTQNSHPFGRRLCFIDDCNFNALAVNQLLDACHDDFTHIRLPVTDEQSFFSAKAYDAIVVNLRYSISIQFNIIRSLVLHHTRGKHKGTVIIITDMSMNCIHVLLRLAGLPYGSGKNFYAIPSRLKPLQMKCTLQDIITGTSVLKPVTAHEFNLTPLRRASLMAMIEGVPERLQARHQNCPIKSVYNHRYIVTQQLVGVSQHAFQCGAFKRIRSHHQDDMSVC
ncbi:hypothetical protein [Citrobacter europaeus]|uniref:hypothetical protein n=1 Tax=Citrobacter europaeus TaxID=1914243 RepID=UPI0039C33123